MHLDEERLQRFVDGELAGGDAAAARAHLAACPPCRERAAATEREQTELSGLFRLLDHPMRAVTANDVVRSRPVARSAGMRWAAGLLLAAGLAGAAYAAPGSPVPGWIGALARSDRPPEASTPGTPPAAEPAGIALPSGERLLVEFSSVQVEGQAIVTLRGGAAVVAVRAPAGAATFGAGVDRITVANAGSRSSFAIEIPADAPRVEIRVAGTTVFTKDGPRVTTRAGADTSTGVYRIPLRP